MHIHCYMFYIFYIVHLISESPSKFLTAKLLKRFNPHKGFEAGGGFHCLLLKQNRAYIPYLPDPENPKRSVNAADAEISTKTMPLLVSKCDRCPFCNV